MENFYKSVLLKTTGVLGVAMLLLLFSNKVNAQLNGNLTINKAAAASSTNFTSFQSLFTALNSQGVNGQVDVTVLNGPYTEQVEIKNIPGASATNQIVIDGNSQTIGFSASSSSNRHTIWFNGADYVTLKNLRVEARGTTYAWVVRCSNQTEYLTIDNCTLTTTNYSSTSSTNGGFLLATNSATSPTSLGDNVRNLTVKNSTLTGGTGNSGPYYGVVIYQDDEKNPIDVKFHNNVVKNFYIYATYFYRVNGLEFFDNEITRDVGYTRISTTYGTYVTQSRDFHIRRNQYHDLFPPGYTGYTSYLIYPSSNTTSSGSDISNNKIYNNVNTGTIYPIYNVNTSGIDIVYNSISYDNQNYSYSGTFRGIFQNGSSASGIIKNNVVSITAPGSGNRTGIYHVGGITDIDNNAINVQGSGTVQYGWSSGGASLTLANWQLATGNGAPFGLNDVEGDPLYTDPENGDLSPQAIGLDDAGAPVSITTDFLNNPRSATKPDIGAKEFTIDANVDQLSTSGGNTGCQGETDDVEVEIKNNASFAISDFYITYKSQGANTKTVSELYKGKVLPGQTLNYTFTEKLEFANTGNVDVTAYIGAKPEIGPYSISINPAPLGLEFTKGTTFNGQFYTGNISDPDIIANPDEIVYNVKPPTGYLNTDYGTKWNISTYTTSTKKGALLSGSDVVRTNPAGGNDLKISVKPSAVLTDDTINVILAAYSLTTLCEAPPVEREIFVAPRPVANFSASNVCQDDEMQFVNTSTISTGTIKYSWDFGDSTVSDFADYTKKYKTFGTYNVKLNVISNYGYTNSISKTVEVYQSPIVGFTHVNKCVGDVVPFTSTSTTPGGSPVYAWDFGDGTTSNSTNPTHNYSVPKVYYATLSVTDAKNCVSSLTKPVTYSDKPVADFTVPTLICNQNNVEFTNTSTPSGNTGYVWDFGNTKTSQTENGATQYTTAASYTVSLTALNDFGCTDTKTKTISITESPIAMFTVNGKCIGSPVDFMNTTLEPSGAATSYQWNFGESGADATTKDGVYTYNAIGNYKIVLKATSSNGCATDLERVVTFGEKPTADFILPSKSCVGENILLQNNTTVDAGNVLIYTWTLGNGNTSTATHPSTSYAAAGNYVVGLTAESGLGCSSTLSKSIEVFSIPNSNFVFRSAQTGDGRMEFTPQEPNGKGTYKWLYGDGTTNNVKGQHNFVYKSLAGLFKVTLIIDNEGCISSTTKDVIINVLGVDQLQAGKLLLYPNPTTGKVTVELNNNSQVKQLRVVDILGKVIAQQNLNTATQQYTFDLSQQAAGVYFIQVVTDGGSFDQKITLTK